MEPRHIIKSQFRVNQFIEHWIDNLSDVSERPEIPPRKVRFWMMQDNSYKPKKNKRYPAPHPLLKGMRGKAVNDSIDFAISSNKW